ncbi:MAG: DNA mismatch repair endonuclease MutL [Bdellovibrionales bacterium]
MIALLAPEVRDQIAAGEVVERPAHLVKELVENSLDAGATEIRVKVREGGRFVEVQDNGRGIGAGELGLALDRFATSKIQTGDDLWRLKTYGFRGEALASLAAVSDLTLISKPPGESWAARIRSQFGAKSSVESVSSEVGTLVRIEKLFENVPARLKFLKTESAENQAIRQVIKAMALSHAKVEFKYFEDEKLVLVFNPTSNLARSEQVLEMKGLYSAEDQGDGWRVEIHFASPEHVGKTSKNIWVFVQGRFVQDRALQTAVTEAYRSLLMHGEYPLVVVQLWAPEDQVDVNIHPTKSQVKFAEPSKAFRFVHHTLRDALEQAPWHESARANAGAQAAAGAVSFAAASQDGSEASLQPSQTATNLHFQDSALLNTQYRQKDFEFATPRLRVEESTSLARSAAPSAGVWSRLEVVGQVGLTYIVAQDQGRLVLIDQHAAHERVAFERLMRAWNGGHLEIQEFLFPFALDLSAAQVEALLTCEADFQKLGVAIERLGPSTLGIRSAPAFVKDRVFAEMMEVMADEILEKGGSFRFEKKVIDLCATMACHSVVRAGQALSHEEMRSLLVQMDEFPLSSFCPHGRPVSVEWSFEKLEKDFGRRV